jgi:hypothetical protein
VDLRSKSCPALTQTIALSEPRRHAPTGQPSPPRRDSRNLNFHRSTLYRHGLRRFFRLLGVSPQVDFFHLNTRNWLIRQLNFELRASEAGYRTFCHLGPRCPAVELARGGFPMRGVEISHSNRNPSWPAGAARSTAASSVRGRERLHWSQPSSFTHLRRTLS